MDKLLSCAKAYESLLSIHYRFIIGRKGKTIELCIRFDRENFHHLAGLHKLRDLEIATENRSKVFNLILKSKVSYDTICKSDFAHHCHDRINVLSKIEMLLDNNNLIFRYNEKTNVFSLIQANFLLSTPLDEQDVYIFISKSEDTDTYFCRSMFPKSDKDYTLGQTKYTLLYKEKINIATGEYVVQFDRLNK